MIQKKRFIPIIVLLFISVFFSSNAGAQTMPSFQMKLSNGKLFSSAEISHKKPLLLIYFAPDCEHCQVLMKQLLKKMSTFKNTEIVMVTFESLQSVAGFEKQYQTHKYPNLKVGMEVPVFFFRKYYQLEHTPFTALFDKNRKLIVSYKENTPIDGLIKKLNPLLKK
ncbi:MAG: redoxin domain-containing protein [Ginsengibacter sp.]